MNMLLTIISLFLLQISCVTNNYFSALRSAKPAVENQTDKDKSIKEVEKLIFHDEKEISIDLFDDTQINAEVFRPSSAITPKQIVVIVPGSGNVSRFGEVNNDGLSTYDEPIKQSLLWAQALVDKGLFVVAYDKRTCQKEHNEICRTTSQKLINDSGIEVLSKDLDSVCRMINTKLSKTDYDITLLSFSQGAQTIALSQCLHKAKKIVLVSPIMKDLESSWVDGLNAASVDNRWEYKKNQLINEAQSTKAFFTSLKKGDFPPSASIRGASVAFWQSWMKAANQTIDLYKKSQNHFLILTANNDPFLNYSVKNIANFTFSAINDVDRNMIKSKELSQDAFNKVYNFIISKPQ